MRMKVYDTRALDLQVSVYSELETGIIKILLWTLEKKLRARNDFYQI